MKLTLAPLTPTNLPAFQELLGGPEFGGCFCAVWTAFGDDWLGRCQDPARPNAQETERRVGAGEHVGFLVFDDDEPVAWTGSGPKLGFPLLATKLASRLAPATEGVWSIGCLAIRADRRGAGLSRRIVDAVVEQAKLAGAKAVEAYPTRPWDEPRSYRGSLSTFERAGFRVEASERDGESEVLVMRLELESSVGETS